MSDLKEVFSKIFESNDWGSGESVSGLGSELKSTEKIREEIPELIKKFKIKSFLDIPCGDFNWMSKVDLDGVDYIGADIVDSLIQKNKEKFPEINFKVLDITKDELPKVDLIFVRDLFGHFSYESIENAMINILSSGTKYLLTTSFTKWDYNVNIENGGWRPINLLITPFRFKPIYLINENCTEGSNLEFSDKCLILFDLESLRN
jgi:SAM-dependent methyltransferase